MKKYIKLALFFALATVTACNDEEKGLVDGIGDNACNAVYMGNINSSGVLSVLASDAEGASFSVTPRLASATNEAIEVTVEVDTETLQEYNKRNNLSVRAIKAEDVFFTDADGKESASKITTTIKPGEVTALISARIKNLDPAKYPYDGRYAIPVKITDAKGSLKLLSSPLYTIANLNRKIKTSVMHLKSAGGGGYTMRFSPKTPYQEEMSEWTLQYIAQFNVMLNQNHTTASLSSGKGFYNRITTTGGLQIKSEGRDGSDTWTNKPINPREWVHVSYVYRKAGLVGKLSVFVNGELQKTFTTSLLYITSGKGDGWGFGNENGRDYYLRELRFWSRALTAAEIQDKYYLPENADAPGLEACFPMSREYFDENTRTFTDITGKWQWSIREGADYTLVDNVVFPAKSLTIEE